MKFVLGFFFSEDRERVLLIKKNRPSFLAGKFNGIGGKVEKDERERKAMIREFEEECGIDTHLADWFFLGLQTFDTGDEMYIFYGFGDITQAVTRTDETIHAVDVNELNNYHMDELTKGFIYQVLEKYTQSNSRDKIELQ